MTSTTAATTITRRNRVKSASMALTLAGAGLVASLGAQSLAPGAQAQAASSIANIPTNIYQTLVNIPAVQYQALLQTTEAFNESGNWWLYIPTNVVGFDQQDYDKVKAISLLLMPIPLIAEAQSEQLWISLATFAPMTENCTGVPGPCSDPLYFLQYGQVPTWQLLTGYTFPSDLRNTIDPENETYTTADGTEVSIQPWWAGETVQLDLFGPLKAIWQTLTQDPTGVQDAPTTEEWIAAYSAYAEAVWNGLNPFVEGSYCLPCQLVGTEGAPGSLPKFALFGKYYTAFDFGQDLTDYNWVVNRPDYDETTREDYVKVTSLWTEEAWQQIYTDAVASVEDAVELIPQLPTIIPANLEAFGEQVRAFAELLANNIVANIEGLGEAAAVSVGSASELADMIVESFVNAIPESSTSTSLAALSGVDTVEAFTSSLTSGTTTLASPTDTDLTSEKASTTSITVDAGDALGTTTASTQDDAAATTNAAETEATSGVPTDSTTSSSADAGESESTSGTDTSTTSTTEGSATEASTTETSTTETSTAETTPDTTTTQSSTSDSTSSGNESTTDSTEAVSESAAGSTSTSSDNDGDYVGKHRADSGTSSSDDSSSSSDTVG